MTPRRFLALLLVGVIGGVLSGAFGVGGGIVMVPLLIVLTSMDQRQASATSLVAIIPTSIAGAVTYGVEGHLDLAAALIIAVGGIGGALVGARLLRSLPLGWLRWLFIALLVAVAVRLFVEVPEHGADLIFTPWAVGGLVLLGLVMGIASGLFGIGGGVIVVPVLVALFGISDLVAKGTSLLAIIPTAGTGSLSHLRARMVRWDDGLIVGLSATAASFAGVALAVVMPPRLSTTLFAILILAAVTQMAIVAIRSGRRGRIEDGQMSSDSPTSSGE